MGGRVLLDIRAEGRVNQSIIRVDATPVEFQPTTLISSSTRDGPEFIQLTWKCWTNHEALATTWTLPETSTPVHHHLSLLSKGWCKISQCFWNLSMEIATDLYLGYKNLQYEGTVLHWDTMASLPGTDLTFISNVRLRTYVDGKNNVSALLLYEIYLGSSRCYSYDMVRLFPNTGWWGKSVVYLFIWEFS